MRLIHPLFLIFTSVAFIGIFAFSGAYSCSIFGIIMNSCDTMDSHAPTTHHLIGLQKLAQDLIVFSPSLTIISALLLMFILLSLTDFTFINKNYFIYQEYLKWQKPEISYEEKLLDWLSLFNIREFHAFLRVRILAN